MKNEVIEFIIQGSSAEPYSVVFKNFVEGVSATCSCPAGQNGSFCKHRVLIIQGKSKGLKFLNGTEKMATLIPPWYSKTVVVQLIDAISQGEAQIDDIQKKIKAMKAALSTPLILGHLTRLLKIRFRFFPFSKALFKVGWHWCGSLLYLPPS